MDFIGVNGIDDILKNKKAGPTEEDTGVLGGNDRINEKRFRVAIYVDIWVNSIGDVGKDKEEATRVAEEIQENIPNSYIGEVIPWTQDIL